MRAHQSGFEHGAYWAMVKDDTGKVLKYKAFQITWSGEGFAADETIALKKRDDWVDNFNKEQLTSSQNIA